MSGARRFELERSVVTQRDPSSVLAQLRDATTWPEWQPEIVSAEGPAAIAEGDVVTGRARMLGFLVEGRSRAVDVTGSAFEEDVIIGVRMRVRYEIDAGAGGVRITHRLTADLPDGPAGRLLSVFLKMRLRRMQTRVLRALQSVEPST